MAYPSPFYPSFTHPEGNGVVLSRHIPAKDRLPGEEAFKAVSRRLETFLHLSFVPNEKLALQFELFGLAQESDKIGSFSKKPVKTLHRA